MARPRRKDRSWLVLAAAFVGAGAIGGTLLLLMRGMFSVGEDMLASTEDSRPLSGRQRLPADAVRVRAAEHVDAPQAPISAESKKELGDGSGVVERRDDATGEARDAAPTYLVSVVTDTASGWIDVLDADGRVVHDSKLVQPGDDVVVRLPAGSYRARLLSPQGHVATQEFTVAAGRSENLRVELAIRH